MNTSDAAASMAALFREIVYGAPAASPAFVLNRGDDGLFAALDRLTAADASAPPPNGAAPIAAHVDHVRYGIELANRSAAGEDAYTNARWGDAWRTTTVDDAAWADLRRRLRDECDRWLESLAALPDDLAHADRTGALATVVHLAYHLGAMRQIDRALRGPRETG